MKRPPKRVYLSAETSRRGVVGHIFFYNPKNAGPLVPQLFEYVRVDVPKPRPRTAKTRGRK